MAKQAGFSLIELVVVIVLLGALAAYAFPRFVNLEREARINVIQSLYGTTKAAATLAHSKSRAGGLGPNAPINLEGDAIAMVNGYPDAPGMLLAANIEQTPDMQVSQFGNVAFIVFATGKAWTTCGFAYVRAVPPALPNPQYLGPNLGNCD